MAEGVYLRTSKDTGYFDKIGYLQFGHTYIERWEADNIGKQVGSNIQSPTATAHFPASSSSFIGRCTACHREVSTGTVSNDHILHPQDDEKNQE